MAALKFSRVAGVTLVGAALLLTACAKEDATSSSSGAAPSDAAQSVQSASGDLCTPDAYAGGVEKIDLQNATVGFAQSEKEANPFRTAETQSIVDEAEARGIKLIKTNAGGDLNQEISDIQSLISQGADVLIISPLKSEGLDPALDVAKEEGVPIMTIDRLLTTKTACEDYIGWVGSDFVEQGKRAADAMNKATGGTAKAVTLLGAAGVNVTDDRNSGYVEQIEAVAPGIEIVAEQSADFDRAKGQTVTAQLLQSNPDLNAIYAHNDEMALGAVAALKAAGKQPGDVKIITIDGTQGAVQGLVDGWIAGVIESNPRFGPLAFKALDDFYNGDGVPATQIIEDKEYTPENAQAELANAY
ncbi:MAG TPA: ABC transporter substrate-binding protein [Actinomycetes bacterium]|nr:ABC transporter substrate-binding protein [Actinomycetes bacterium]